MVKSEVVTLPVFKNKSAHETRLTKMHRLCNFYRSSLMTSVSNRSRTTLRRYMSIEFEQLYIHEIGFIYTNYRPLYISSRTYISHNYVCSLPVDWIGNWPCLIDRYVRSLCLECGPQRVYNRWLAGQACTRHEYSYILELTNNKFLRV